MKPKYCGKVEIIPSINYIKVNLEIQFKSINQIENIYLHKNLNIIDFKCNNAKISEIFFDEQSNSFLPESKCYEISIFSKKEAFTKCNFIYEGEINILKKFQTNRITEEFIELGIYSPWFPLFHDFRESEFDIDLFLPKSYEILNANKYLDFYNLKSSGIDCCIIASNKFYKKSFLIENHLFNIYYLENKRIEFSEIIIDSIKKSMKFYLSNFGKIEPRKISLFISPKREGGGYCRKNIIVIDDYKMDKEKILEYIAHELAHQWWSKANTLDWEDWLNESFAEYSSLMITRKYLGKARYQEIIDKYEKLSKTSPAIKDLSRSNSEAYISLYYKGSLILKKLEVQIGINNFKNLLKNIHIKKIKTTEHLLNYIKAEYGIKIYNLLLKEITD